MAQKELEDRQAKELRGGSDPVSACVTNCKCDYISSNDPSDPLHGLAVAVNNKVDQTKKVANQ